MEALASTMKNERRSRSKPFSSSSSSSSSRASLIMAFVPCLSWLYIAGRLWKDSENRLMLLDLLHKNSANRPKVLTVEDKLMNLGSKEIERKIVEDDMGLTLAKSQGHLRRETVSSDKKFLAIIGVYMGFGSRLKRNVFRGTWILRGDALSKLEEKGVVIRFVNGRSPNRGDSLDSNIDEEMPEQRIFFIYFHEEAAEELPQKAKFFFSSAVDSWNAEFYVKVNDDINLDIDGLIEILKAHSGQVSVACTWDVWNLELL